MGCLDGLHDGWFRLHQNFDWQREYLQHTGYKVGFKPAGGISNAKTALNFMAMMKDELGTEWLQPHLFRIGASSLVTDIERQLSHHATGQYAADYYMPMS